jgi:hypothetical protein
MPSQIAADLEAGCAPDLCRRLAMLRSEVKGRRDRMRFGLDFRFMREVFWLDKIVRLRRVHRQSVG